MAKLTDKQKIFVNEYLATDDLNVTVAYKKAYPGVKNDNVAAVCGSRLLKNAKVKEYIDKRMKEREQRTEITQDKVLKELSAIAFSNGANYARVVEKIAYDKDGEEILDPETKKPLKYKAIDFKNTDELTATEKKAIAGIHKGKDGMKVETYDKLKALELLGKHLGMFKDNVNINANINSTKKLDAILGQLIGDDNNE